MMNDTLSSIKAELATMKKGKSAAFKRMKQQQKCGDIEGARLSRSAYEYCRDYAQRLENIIDGYQRQLDGETYFTKNGADRYVNRSIIPPSPICH